VADADDAAFAEMLRRLADSAGDDPLALDDDTAERLLAGDLDPADAPPGYAEVAVVLAAATAEPDPDELIRAAAAVAELAAVTRPGAAAARPARGPGRRRRTGLAVAVVVGALSMGGVAAAATGHLPEPIREVARTILTAVGVATSGPPAEPTPSTTEAGAGGAAGDGQGTRPTGAANHGQRRQDSTSAPVVAGAPGERLCRAFLSSQAVRQSQESEGSAFQAQAAAGGGDETAGYCQGTRPAGQADHRQGQSAPPGTAGNQGTGRAHRRARPATTGSTSAGRSRRQADQGGPLGASRTGWLAHR
jgi:hypothetical protein